MSADTKKERLSVLAWAKGFPFIEPDGGIEKSDRLHVLGLPAITSTVATTPAQMGQNNLGMIVGQGQGPDF